MNSLQKFGTTVERKHDWADLCEVTFISGTALYNAALLVLHWASSQVTGAMFPSENWGEVRGAVATCELQEVGMSYILLVWSLRFYIIIGNEDHVVIQFIKK